jgi:hypothetical protein
LVEYKGAEQHADAGKCFGVFQAVALLAVEPLDVATRRQERIKSSQIIKMQPAVFPDNPVNAFRCDLFHNCIFNLKEYY